MGTLSNRLAMCMQPLFFLAIAAKPIDPRPQGDSSVITRPAQSATHCSVLTRNDSQN